MGSGYDDPGVDGGDCEEGACGGRLSTDRVLVPRIGESKGKTILSVYMCSRGPIGIMRSGLPNCELMVYSGSFSIAWSAR